MADKKTKKKKGNSLTALLSGDVLTTEGLRKQLGLIALIVVLAIFYIDNRYTVQRQQIQIDKLKKELEEYRYRDLTRSSELMEISRQSKIEEYVQKTNSDLQTSTEPPYVIKENTKDK
jgi:hypothetical protein